MPIRSLPTFNATSDKVLEIATPAYKGVNLFDLEYKQDVSQSPYIVNMMYRNGSLAKRYGQEYYKEFNDNIYNAYIYKDNLFIHSGTKIYKNNKDTVVTSNIAEKKGLFVAFNQSLYYFCDDIYCYDGTEWKKVEPYVPIVVINRKPDGTSGNTIEAYNMVGTGFQNNFHGDGSSTTYKLTDTDLEQKTPKVTIDNEEWTYDANLSATKTFKVNYSTGVITLKSAAPSGTNNVEIVAYKRDDEWDDYHEQIVNSKYYACFGGNNNSRLFLAGGGKSTYYYSEVYDASYFPYTNYAKVGNSAEDITGFGQQYNVLIVFKPTEIYSLTYYQASYQSTTTDESQSGVGMFTSQVVNGSVGCDCPDTIQLINNQLTWVSSREGVCTLVSTNIVDERNVRPISRNIDRGNVFGIQGLLEWEDLKNITSIDFDKKYFLVNKTNGKCFMWDYDISPYVVKSSSVTNPKDLAWFYFDNMFVNKFIKEENKLIYISSSNKKKIAKLNESFNDFGEKIKASLMTPFMQFGAVEYLKDVTKIYVQCRGDTSSAISIKAYTEKSTKPKSDIESIRVGGKIWSAFDWNTFQWNVVNYAKTFRRKISLKKIQMCAFLFENDEVDRDMSISHISLQYKVVKFVK